MTYLIMTFVILVAEHYIPWRMVWMVFRREMHVTANYVLGVLGFAVPYTCWLLSYGQGVKPAENALWFWAFVVVAGLAVIGAYALDWLLLKLLQLQEKEEELELKDEQSQRS